MFSTDARTGHPAERPAAKPLSALGSIGVAGTTAAIVFASGVYLVETGGTGARKPPRADEAAALANVTASAAPSIPPKRETAGAPSEPTASRVAPEPLAPPPPSSSAEASPAGNTRAALDDKQTTAAPRKGYGVLTVTSARDATVYVTGVAVGLSNRPVEARCGPMFVRLGEPTADGTHWLGPGKTVIVQCDAQKALTEAHF